MKPLSKPSVATTDGVQVLAPGMHTPPPQRSPLVHELPSLQGAVLFACAHPLVGAQPSSVHGLPSSQASGVPATQPLAGLQVSAPLQASPSLQTRAVPATQEPA